MSLIDSFSDIRLPKWCSDCHDKLWVCAVMYVSNMIEIYSYWNFISG